MRRAVLETALEFIKVREQTTPLLLYFILLEVCVIRSGQCRAIASQTLTSLRL